MVEQLISADDVATTLQISRTTMHRLIKRNQFPARRKLLGDKTIYFDRDEIADWMINCRMKTIK